MVHVVGDMQRYSAPGACWKHAVPQWLHSLCVGPETTLLEPPPCRHPSPCRHPMTHSDTFPPPLHSQPQASGHYRIVAIFPELFVDLCLLQPANFPISRALAAARLSWDPNTPSTSVIPWTPFRVLFLPLPLVSYLSLIILCMKLPLCWSHWMQWLTASSFQGEASQWQGCAPVPMRPPWETTCLTTLNIPQNVDAYAIKSLLLMNQWIKKKLNYNWETKQNGD